MTKFFQLSAICMLAVCSLVTIGCSEGDKKPMVKEPAASSNEDGEAGSGATSETSGEAMDPKAGSGTKE